MVKEFDIEFLKNFRTEFKDTVKELEEKNSKLKKSIGSCIQ